MGSYSFLQVFTVVFALSIATTLFNKRVLGLPAAIGVPIVSAIFVFLLQWAVSLFGHNDYIHINIDEIEKAVRTFNFYDFLINGVICFILTSSALKFKITDLRVYFKPIAILASIALILCAIFFGLALWLPSGHGSQSWHFGVAVTGCGFGRDRPDRHQRGVEFGESAAPFDGEIRRRIAV